MALAIFGAFADPKLAAQFGGDKFWL